MDLLVTVPAAIEEALASLMLDPSDPSLQARGAITYVRRLYYPHLIGQPLYTPQPTSGSGLATITWLYQDPLAGCGREGHGRTCAGALLMIKDLASLPSSLETLDSELLSMGMGRPPLSLHIVVTGSHTLLASDADGSSVDPAKARLDGSSSIVCRSELGSPSIDLASHVNGADQVGTLQSQC
jgi:hypothetical protein